jgi:hypothetical protein
VLRALAVNVARDSAVTILNVDAGEEGPEAHRSGRGSRRGTEVSPHAYLTSN